MKTIYLFFVSLLSRMNENHESSDIVYLMDFPENNTDLIRDLSRYFEERLVVCYTKRAENEAMTYAQEGIRILAIDSFLMFFWRIVPILTKAPVILADGCFDFLGAIQIGADTKVIQLWHANGSIKKFGYLAHYTEKQPRRKQEREKNMYEKFTHFVVGSDKISSVFKEAWLADEKEMLTYGTPKCDQYFSEKFLGRARAKLKAEFPIVKDKRLIMYAPTSRKTQQGKLSLGLAHMNTLMEKIDARLLIRTHPKERHLLDNLGKFDHIFTMDERLTLAEILPSVDVLITDYSSIPFEYSLANPQGKMFFYCYDLEDYKEEVGLMDDFEEWAPGEIVQTQGALMQGLQEYMEEDTQASNHFEAFNELWSQYNHGKASDDLLMFLKNLEE